MRPLSGIAGHGRQHGPARTAPAPTALAPTALATTALSRSALAHTALAVSGWACIAVGFALELAVGGTDPGARRQILVWTLCLFFATQVTRLAVAVAGSTERRPARLQLLAAVLLWGLGSAVVNGGAQPDLEHFPAPGEVLFLLAYVALAWFLVTDAEHTLRRPLDSWLHVTVICGGAACFIGALLLLPLAGRYAESNGLQLLLSLLYPFIDLLLALLVLGQVMLRLRPGGRHAAGIIAGLLCFAYADAHFVSQFGNEHYRFSALTDAAWGAGFALLVSAACAAPRPVRALPRGYAPADTLLAAATAVLVLVLHPEHAIGVYLTLPAVLTLFGAGGRLVLALREANSSAEALALSRTDDLTRLPNRRALRDSIDAALAAGRTLSLLLLDLDGFKDINDTLGHQAGDKVLQMTAHRIRGVLPPTVTVARLGGDEFAVLTENEADTIAATERARLLIGTVHQAVRVDGIDVTPSASIGLTTVDGGRMTATEVLRRADVAMYQAKSTRTGVVVYDPHYDDFSKSKLALAEDLRRALSADELELWYQPQVDAATRQLCGLEGLVRWRHPTKGVLPPAAFLPGARRAGLMPNISVAMARKAVADLARWHATGLHVTVALNCAPPELLSGTFLPSLYAELATQQLQRSSLIIEVTEDSFIAEPERARELLTEIRQHGLQVSIDDYGTGFSSLAYLRDLPVDELKIDRTFIAAMGSDSRSRMIVASTLQMASALGLRTVAEGVEDAATAADLIALGVDVLQGYHLARPMTAAEVVAWERGWASLVSLDPTGELVGPQDHHGTSGWWPAGSPIRAARVHAAPGRAETRRAHRS